MTITESNRLQISHLTTSDAAFILQLVNEPAFLEYIGDKKVRTSNQAIHYLTAGPITSYRENGFGLYRVSLKKEDIPIGICGLKKRDSLPMPDLGYAFLKKYRGKGFATEAGLAVINYAKQHLELQTVAAITATDNEASMRLLEKLGFSFEKIVELPEFDSKNNLFTTKL